MYMIMALFQSPITAKKVFEWKEKLEKNEILIREIIDMNSTYIEAENLMKKKIKKNKKKKRKSNDELKKI